MWLFLIALFMLFSAAMLAYVVIRLQAEHPTPAMQASPQNRRPVPPGSLQYPQILWLSTALVIAVSVAIGRALHNLRLERQSAFRRWMRITMLLGAAFLLVQAPAMAILVSEHQRLRSGGLFLYGLLFTLVLLHALHVVGGIVAMVRLGIRARRGDFDHENYIPVRNAALYWHFLDVIWVLMFSTFLLTR